MAQSTSRQLDGSPIQHRRARWTIYLALASMLSSATVHSAAEDLSLSVTPNPATIDDPIVVTVEGTASCPELVLGATGEDFVDIGFRDSCAILPPSPGPFTLFTVLDPLPAGLWEIRLLDLHVPIPPPLPVAAVDLTVLDPRYSVMLTPSPATEQDTVTAHVAGVGTIPFLDMLVIEPGRIQLYVIECGPCDPPAPTGPFEIDQELGQLAIGDYEVELFFNDDRVAESSLQVLPAGACLPGETVLCLNDGRFRVEATWETSAGLNGPAHAVEETADTGLFWFFDADNLELMVKVLDACDTEFETFWVFAGGLTDVGVTLQVTDTEADETVTYENPVGTVFETITDTAAFATCP